jgi:hypothetical protein
MSDRLPKSTRPKRKREPKPADRRKGQVVLVPPGFRCEGCGNVRAGSFAVEVGRGVKAKVICLTCFDPSCAEVPADGA